MSDSVETVDEVPESIDDAAIRAVVTRLARPEPSGGKVIERAAILAEGRSSAAILAWLVTHDWVPEEDATPGREHVGLHAARAEQREDRRGRPARRYVLPAGRAI